MSSARRTLLTATAAGTLLGALWFVPSASATGDAPARTAAGAASAARGAEQGEGGARTLSVPAGSPAAAAGFRAASAPQAATPHTDTGTRTDTGTGTRTDTGTGTQTDTGTGTRTDTGTDAGTRTQTSTDAGPHPDAAAEDGPLLADTGSPDTTPYVVGGTAFLALGAGFVVYSVRRERLSL